MQFLETVFCLIDTFILPVKKVSFTYYFARDAFYFGTKMLAHVSGNIYLFSVNIRNTTVVEIVVKYV